MFAIVMCLVLSICTQGCSLYSAARHCRVSSPSDGYLPNFTGPCVQ